MSGRTWTLLMVIASATVVPATSALAGGGCHAGASQGRGDTVRMVDACFTPSVLHAAPGTKVTFVNEDPMIHDVAATRWASPGDLRDGEMFTSTFDEEGIYPFACSYHAGMTGAIVVGDGLGAGSGAQVDVTPIGDDASPVAAVKPADRGDDRPLAWAGLGALAGLGLAAVAVTLRRRKAS